MGYKIWSGTTNREEDTVDATLQDWRVMSDDLGRDLSSGRPVAHKWPKLIYDISSAYPPVDAFMSGPELIISKRMAHLIFEYVPASDMEYLPVTLNYQGQPYGNYGVLHALSVIEALDKQHSTYTTRRGKISRVTKLALDENKLQGKPLVRLDTSTWLICVSDKLATAIEQSGMHGVVFPTPEKWRPY